MFSTEELEHFWRSWPSSRAGTLKFHEFSRKTSSFPSTQCDDYTESVKAEHSSGTWIAFYRGPHNPFLLWSSMRKLRVLAPGHAILTMDQLELRGKSHDSSWKILSINWCMCLEEAVGPTQGLQSWGSNRKELQWNVCAVIVLHLIWVVTQAGIFSWWNQG